MGQTTAVDLVGGAVVFMLWLTLLSWIVRGVLVALLWSCGLLPQQRARRRARKLPLPEAGAVRIETVRIVARRG